MSPRLDLVALLYHAHDNLSRHNCWIALSRLPFAVFNLSPLTTSSLFDRIIICGDFNPPKIDWTTGTAISGKPICNHFTKSVIRDNFLCQMVDFPTRQNNILDLVLTNISSLTLTHQGFDDILHTDHQEWVVAK